MSPSTSNKQLSKWKYQNRFNVRFAASASTSLSIPASPSSASRLIAKYAAGRFRFLPNASREKFLASKCRANDRSEGRHQTPDCKRATKVVRFSFISFEIYRGYIPPYRNL